MYLVVAFFLAILVLVFVRKLFGKPSIPGPINIPGFGILPNIFWKSIRYPKRSHLFLLVHEYYKKYGPVFSFNFGIQQYVCISDYKSIKEALLNHSDIFSGRPQNPFYQYLAKGRGIIFSEGPIWHEHRRFSLRVLKDFGFGRTDSELLIKSEARELIYFLKDISKSSAAGEVNMKELLAKAVVNVIAGFVFHDRSSYEDPQFEEFLNQISKVTQTGLAQLLMVFYPIFCNEFFINASASSKEFLASEEWLMKLCKHKIEQIRLHYQPENEPRCYIESYFRVANEKEKESTGGHSFDDLQLIRTVFDLYLAGADTTTNTLRWLLLYSALHSKMQEKCYQEIVSTVGHREIGMSDKRNLPYIQAFIDETMRISSLVPHSVEHRATKDFNFNGHLIPSDAIIFINLYAVHHDPDVFPDPHCFQPTRFLNSNGSYQPHDHLIPFGIGKRSCLGEILARMEIFVFFCSLIQHFEFNLSESTKADLDAILLGTDGIIHAPEVHTLLIKPRITD